MIRVALCKWLKFNRIRLAVRVGVGLGGNLGTTTETGHRDRATRDTEQSEFRIVTKADSPPCPQGTMPQ